MRKPPMPPKGGKPSSSGAACPKCGKTGGPAMIGMKCPNCGAKMGKA